MMRLDIVVPCFNEEEVIPECQRRLAALLARLQAQEAISAESSIYFVDDGSRDRTWPLIESMAGQNPHIHGVKLSCNRGHQAALLAGILEAKGDLVVSVDADLQDDVEVIEEMVARNREGYDIVYGVRDRRSTDTYFKRTTAELYYRILSGLGVEVVHNHADFRLLSRRAVECLRQYDEVNLFLRGIIPMIGLKATTVSYARAERFAGSSKYPLRKMLALALDGITSFTPVPLRLIAFLGFLVFLFSIGMTLWVLWIRLFTERAVPGWASLLIPVYFLGGIQLLSVGILGEYTARIYLEAKRRPRYFVEKVV